MTEVDHPCGVQRVRIDVVDVEQATELIRERYADHDPSFSGDRAGFSLTLRSTSVDSGAGRFRLDRITHSMAVSALTEPADELRTVEDRRARWTAS